VRFIFTLMLTGCAAISVGAQDAPSPDPNSKNLPPTKEVHIHLQRVKQGGAVAAARLINRVQPVYPPLARQTRVSGAVRLHAIIGKDGNILQLEVLSGHPLLVQSALDAVHQWKYRPVSLEGDPVEVDTTIDVIYSLAEDVQEKAPQLMTLAHRPIDSALREDLVKLMQLSSSADRAAFGARKAIEPMRPMMFRNVGDEALRQKIVDSYEEKLVAIFNTDDFREGVITAYAKYFDDDDVKKLIAFYDTPLGRKFNDVMPQFSSDLIELGQRLAKDRIPLILRELCNEYPDDLAGKLPDCTAPDKDKKSQLMPETANPAGIQPVR